MNNQPFSQTGQVVVGLNPISVTEAVDNVKKNGEEVSSAVIRNFFVHDMQKNFPNVRIAVDM